MARRFKRPQFIVGIGTLLCGLGYFLTEVFTGGIPMTWPFSTGIWVSLVLVAVGISLIIWGLVRDTHDEKRGSSALTYDDKKYMARLNKELHNISDYYRGLARKVMVKNIQKSKILEIDDRLAKYIGIIPIKVPKPPKKLNIYKVICILFFDIFKLMLFVVSVRLSKSRLFKVYLDIGSIPDDVGIGLSSYDLKKEQLTKHLLRVAGERISSNETISAILRCKDACYAINNIYLWVLMYPKGHKKSRLDIKRIIKTIYDYRDKMMAYAVAEVNKAIIKEFLGN